MELWYLVSEHYLMMLNICTKFQENVSKGLRVIKDTEIWHYSVKNVGGIMVLIQAALSDNALYLY